MFDLNNYQFTMKRNEIRYNINIIIFDILKGTKICSIFIITSTHNLFYFSVYGALNDSLPTVSYLFKYQ